MGYETIFPASWGLKRPSSENNLILETLGYDLTSLEERVRNCVYLFLDKLFDTEERGLHHYYRADTQYVSELDSGNFLMAINYITMYDMTGDPMMLERAEACFMWGYNHATETHPMFTWQGGVRDGFKNNELYVKYTGDAFLTCIALYKRTKKDEYFFILSSSITFSSRQKRRDLHTNMIRIHMSGLIMVLYGSLLVFLL